MVFLFRSVLLWVFCWRQRGVAEAAAMSLTSSSLCMFGSANAGVVGGQFSLELQTQGSQSRGKRCHPDSFREGTGLRQPWHLRRVGCPDVILIDNAYKYLPYYCGVKTKSRQMAISQYQMSCFACLWTVLWPLVMYKDFSYFIFQQQWSFRSNCQFNGANNHQNKENYTVTLSFFRKGNHLHSLWC